MDVDLDKQLKGVIHQYFEDCKDRTKEELVHIGEARNVGASLDDYTETGNDVSWDAVSRDVRSLINVNSDVDFTGRAIARIFHGIDSPCFPAIVWGRNRRYWRKYLDVDFNKLRIFATRLLIDTRK